MQSTKLAPFTVWFNQSEEFHSIKREVFSQGAYYVELESAQPLIIDAGAHIGLATLYFKKMYPNAKIWSIEPLIENFKLLEKNVQENQLSDIVLIQAALTKSGAETTLYLDSTPLHWWSTAGKEPHGWNHQQTTTSRQVPATQLSQLLREIGQPIDLLKLDIEGSEQEVLVEAQPQLKNVHQMMIEYHPTETQSLSKILTFLENNSFSCDLWKDGKSVLADRAKGLLLIQATKNS